MNSFKEKALFLNYIVKKDYYKDIKNKMSAFTQHKGTSTFVHSRNVAYCSFEFANFLERKFNANFNYETLVVGCYLHDFFLYDWHEKGGNHRLHGFTHPKVADANAKKFCQITKKESDMILSHMWPLTITKVPKSKEAWVLCLCDKFEASREVISHLPKKIKIKFD